MKRYESVKVSKEIMEFLKARYFRLLAKEKYPTTPSITKSCDTLEGLIRDCEVTDAS